MKTKNLILSLIMLFAVFSTTAQMRVHLINVGQGCATLVEFPCAAILIDTGGEINGLYNSSNALKNYLDDFFIRRADLNHTLQAVYLTHPHSDHTLGVPVILQPPFIIKNVITDGLEEGSGKAGQIALHRLAQASEETAATTDDIGFEAVNTTELGTTGLTNNVIDAVNCIGTDPSITALWGTSTTNPGWTKAAFNDENNHSVVLRITYGSSILLITGDMEDTAQTNLLAKYAGTNLLDADVYVVGHHGSKNGTSQQLLEKISPIMALIGAGDTSRKVDWTAWAYGHPNKGILDMLQSAITATRPTINVQAGLGAKTFVDYTVSKAIYATGWDDNVVLEADSTGNWKKLDTAIEPVFALIPQAVNVNSATETILQALPGIGIAKAKAIVKYRKDNGKITSLAQMDKIPGIGQATLNLIQAYVIFN